MTKTEPSKKTLSERIRTMKRPHFQEAPTWKMFIALFSMMLLITVIGAFVMLSIDNKVDTSIQETRQQGLINRAVACMDIVYREEIELTDECRNTEVAAFYPSDICERLTEVFPCGRDAQNTSEDVTP